MTATVLTSGASCPVPLVATDRVQLGHGSGGKMSAALLKERFLPLLDNPVLRQLGDAGVVPVHGGEIAMSTDTFVVSPLVFPGGNIGSLAVHGTLNDLAMMGARPHFLSTGFVLEEGLPFATLDRVIAAMAEAARENGVMLIAGDTKVVERGRADGLYVNTTGIGILDESFRPRPDAVRAGDVLLVSGPIAQHGMAIMSRARMEPSRRSRRQRLPRAGGTAASAANAVHALRDRRAAVSRAH
jgi:hydrogenase expression/formation protein HypE